MKDLIDVIKDALVAACWAMAIATLVGLGIVGFSGCSHEDRLVPLPESEGESVWIPRSRTGADAIRWREALPPPPPPPPDCGLEIVWPADLGPPQGDCRPGWFDSCNGVGEPPVTPTQTDGDCDGINDDECSTWAMLLLLDGSGSMHEYRGAVHGALGALNGRADALRSVVLFGDRFPEHAVLGAPWGADIAAAYRNTSGPEWAGEAALLAVPLVEGWPAGHARMMIIVTDEPPQSSPMLWNDTGDNGTLLLEEDCSDPVSGYHVGVITDSRWVGEWHNVVTSCGGFISLLNTDDIVFQMSGADPDCVVAPQ
jgi:hypothetical protein